MSAENLTADTYLTERLAQYQNWYDKKAVACTTSVRCSSPHQFARRPLCLPRKCVPLS